METLVMKTDLKVVHMLHLEDLMHITEQGNKRKRSVDK